MRTSEARKREEHAAKVAASEERRREVVQQALAEVWFGADFTDADAVLDHLSDLGARVEIEA